MADPIIPIKVAREIAEKHGLRQIIITGWDGVLTYVATWGKGIEDCDQAAQGGDFIRKALNWPETGPSYPPRVQAMLAALLAVRDVRPTNWDDDEDPHQVAAWRAVDAAILAAAPK